MILRIYYEGDKQPTDVTDRPTVHAVAESIASVDWNRLAFVTIYKDEGAWLEGSGCLASGFGLSVTLKLDHIEFVSEAELATPESMLAYFEAFLTDDMDSLFALLYDASRRGLSAKDIEELRQEETASQLERRMREAVAEAAELFSSKDYAGYIQKLTPFENQLGSIDAKKLALARKRESESQP